MTQKLTHDYIEKELARIGFSVLSKYIDAKSPLKVKCPGGHIRITRWDKVRSGQCATCANNILLEELDYISRGAVVGLKWVSESLPKNSSSLTQWECSSGHIFTRTMNAIVTGHIKCPICTRRRHLTEIDYKQLAQQVGIEWFGPFPENNSHNTNWKCSKGHIYSTSYKSVSRRGRFSSCAQCKTEAFVGAGHPRWRGGWDSSATKHRNRLKRYNLLEKNNTDADVLTYAQWKRAKEYFRHCCCYCGEPPRQMQKDHFIPIVEGGQHTVRNVVPSCPSCNHSKHKRMPFDWLTIKYGTVRAEEIYHSILVYFDQTR